MISSRTISTTGDLINVYGHGNTIHEAQSPDMMYLPEMLLESQQHTAVLIDDMKPTSFIGFTAESYKCSDVL